MLPQVNITKLYPDVYKALMTLEEANKHAEQDAALEPLLADLVKIRCSQLNGCAFCLRMHTREAIAHGETADRLSVVGAWWESQYFTPAEQAALTLAERVTRIGDQHTAVAASVDVAAVLTEKQIAAVVALAIAINAWNRLAIMSHFPVAP
jgi:AhpD family alkylhydroperoxidase